jgi:SnoaL-like domain
LWRGDEISVGQIATTEAGPVDAALAIEWYGRWIAAWNSHDPANVACLVTEDFILESPTTRHTEWVVQGPDAVSGYVAYVVGAYPDLMWECIRTPCFSADEPRACFDWRGWGHFTGRLDPPGIEGNGTAFEFFGVEIFEFRDDKASRLQAHYDLLGLMKQIGLYRGATSR